MNSYKLSKRVNIPNSAHDFLDGGDYSDKKLTSGFIHNTNKFWFACGPNLAIFNRKTGVNICRWTFGSALNDVSTKIVSIKELKLSHKESSLLVVGLECNIYCGMVCIFDISSRKVLRAIQFVNKVTSLHVISSGSSNSLFPGPLNNFDGAIAVGTLGGDVYIIDLCKENIDEAKNEQLNLRDELNPCEIKVVHIDKIMHLEYLKQAAERNQQHLAIHLNAQLGENTPHFVLKGPHGEDRVLVNKEEVCVSALEYAPQLCSVFVGYNFGALQVWNAVNMSLVYTSQVNEENIPVSYFAIQEPVDDPRAFCYFWAVHSHTEQVPKIFPIAALYYLKFDYKDWHEGYGYIYKDLQSCSSNFQIDLNKINSNTCSGVPVSAQCVHLESFSKNNNKDVCSTSFLDNHEDNFTLCLMVWNVCFKDQSTSTYITLFDLNQWYKEQMPDRIRDDQCIKYMLNVCISDVVYKNLNHKIPLMDVQINTETILPFNSLQKLEEIFYPTSLAFECITLSEQEICVIQNCGNQRQFLNELQDGGPLILIKPLELYEMSVKLGFSPICVENVPNLTNRVSLQEHILNIALEYKMKNWLFKCAFSWSNGSHRSAGLSLDFLLDWAWKRVNSLKASCNKISGLLFDCMQDKLDENTKMLFSQCRSQILILKDLYCYICNTCSQFLINEVVTIKQCECIKQIFAYLDVLSWMINIGLLPEGAIVKSVNDENRLVIPYLVEDLIKYYTQRRKYLNELNRNKKIFDNEPILYIDKIINIAGKDAIKKEWMCDGGSGTYPPNSLQTILRTYLLDNVKLYHNHIILSYFLLDVATTLPKEKYQSILPTLIKFPTIFNLSSTDVKIIQGLWELDHGNFGTAVEQIIDPSIKSITLPCWFHSFILKNLLLNDEKKLALIYLKIRNPALNTSEEISMGISLYVSNNMVSKALEMQRQYSGGEKNVLKVLYEECVKEKQLMELLTLNLTKKEESSIMEFMEATNFPDKNQCKFIYYFQRNKLVHLYDMFNTTSRNMKNELGNLNAVMDAVKNGLPVATQNALNICMSEKNDFIQKEPNPKPLSVFCHNKKEQLNYKSNFLYACFKKAKEAWTKDNTNQNNFPSDDFPFLRSHHKIEKKSLNSKLIYPQFVRSFPSEDSLEDEGPSPPKRLKLSPERSLYEESMDNSSIIHLTKIITPVIKRKSYRTNDSFKKMSDSDVLTPHSILKVHKDETMMHYSPETPHHNSNISNNIFNKRSFSSSFYESTPCEKQVSGASRKSLSRTSVVRFKENHSVSSGISSLENSPLITGTPDKTSSKVESKNSSVSTDTDTFVTPEVSLNADNNETPKIDIDNSLDVVLKKDSPTKAGINTESPRVKASLESRKSYREDILKTPVRSSPRRKSSINNDTQKSALNSSVSTKTPELNSPLPVKISGRRSLSRQALENNAASKLLSSTDLNTSTEPNKIFTTEISFSKKETVKTIGKNILEQSTEINSFFDKKVEESKNDGRENTTTESHNEIRTCVKTIARTESVDENDEMEVSEIEFDNNVKSLVTDDNKIDQHLQHDIEVKAVNKSKEREEEVIQDSTRHSYDPKMNNFHVTDELVPNVVGPSENEIEYVKELASPQYTYHEKEDSNNSDSVKHIYPEVPEIEDQNKTSDNETKIEEGSKNLLNEQVVFSDGDTSPEISDKSTNSSISDPLNKGGIDIISVDSGSDDNTLDIAISEKYVIDFNDSDDESMGEDNISSDFEANKAFFVKDLIVENSNGEQVLETYSVDSDSNENSIGELVFDSDTDDKKSASEKSEKHVPDDNKQETNKKTQKTKDDLPKHEVKPEKDELVKARSEKGKKSKHEEATTSKNEEATTSKNEEATTSKNKEATTSKNEEASTSKNEEATMSKNGEAVKHKGRTRRSLSVQSDTIEARQPTTPMRVTRRSLRAASVDTPMSPPKAETKPRRSSINKIETSEVKSQKNSVKGRRSNIFPKAKSVDLTDDDKKKSIPRRKSFNLPLTPKEKEVDLLSEYSSSRRLTRNQKMLLEKSLQGSLKLSKSVTSEGSEKDDDSIQLEHIDPIQLLTKDEFHGPKDPDEHNFLETVSVSSLASDSNASELPSPKKDSIRRKNVFDSPSVKKSNRKRPVNLDDEFRRCTRSRSKSISECSDSGSTTSTTSKRRGRTAKTKNNITELEKITEESAEELEKSTTKKKKRT